MQRRKTLVAALLCLGLLLMPLEPALACSAYDDHINRAASRYDVPAWLIKGLIAAESGFRADAYRPEPRVNDAAHGLMQILLSTARDMGYWGSSSGLMDPATNIDLGTRYLGMMMERFDRDYELAVAAYNAGPGLVGRLVDRYGKSFAAIRPHLETGTRNHVAKVMNYASQFRAGQAPLACPGGAAPRADSSSSPLTWLFFLAIIWALANQ